MFEQICVIFRAFPSLAQGDAHARLAFFLEGKASAICAFRHFYRHPFRGQSRLKKSAPWADSVFAGHCAACEFSKGRGPRIADSQSGPPARMIGPSHRPGGSNGAAEQRGAALPLRAKAIGMRPSSDGLSIRKAPSAEFPITARWRRRGHGRNPALPVCRRRLGRDENRGCGRRRNLFPRRSECSRRLDFSWMCRRRQEVRRPGPNGNAAVAGRTMLLRGASLRPQFPVGGKV